MVIAHRVGQFGTVDHLKKKRKAYTLSALSRPNFRLKDKIMIAQSFLKSNRVKTLAANLSFHASHTDLGHAGEMFAIELFKANGYIARKTDEKRNGDIAVICPKTGEIRRIEVKSATKSTTSQKSWQFCINKGKKTSCDYADFCLLVLVDKNSVFCYLVPCEVLHGLSCVKIHSHPTKYRGKLAPYILRDEINFDSCLLVSSLSKDAKQC